MNLTLIDYIFIGGTVAFLLGVYIRHKWLCHVSECEIAQQEEQDRIDREYGIAMHYYAERTRLQDLENERRARQAKAKARFKNNRRKGNIRL